MRIHQFLAAAAVVMSTGLAVQAQQGTNLYPVDKRVQVYEGVTRPCTQLEHAAGIAAADCGAMPLGDVAKKFFETSETGDED